LLLTVPAVDLKLFADRFAFDAVLLSIVVCRGADLLQAAIAKDLAAVMAISVGIHEEKVDVESSAAGDTRKVTGLGDSKAVLSDGLVAEIDLKTQKLAGGRRRAQSQASMV
jgi:hypothetical protein